MKANIEIEIQYLESNGFGIGHNSYKHFLMPKLKEIHVGACELGLRKFWSSTLVLLFGLGLVLCSCKYVLMPSMIHLLMFTDHIHMHYSELG